MMRSGVTEGVAEGAVGVEADDMDFPFDVRWMGPVIQDDFM